MKETKVSKQQHLYKVRVFKDFDFPSFSIDKENRLQDLFSKSLDEVGENFHKGERYFDFEVMHVLPFTFTREVERVNTERASYDFNFFIREIAMNDLEAKYGKLDYDSNPTIFDRRTRNNGEIDPHSPFNLKADVEEYYLERVRHYCSILENKMV